MRRTPANRPHTRKGSIYRTIFLLLPAVLLAALSQSGCGLASGTLVISPTSLNFGSVAIGSSSNQTITLTNSGNNAITLMQIAASGGGFTLKGPTLPLTLAGGQSAAFTITFAPSAMGSVSGSLSITRSQPTSTRASPASVPLAPGVSTQMVTVAMTGAGAAPPPPPQITTGPLPNAQAGIQFQASLTATGGVQPYVWSVITGTLPSGITLNAATGMLSGTPALGGQFDFSVQVSDSSSPTPQTAMKALTLSVLAFALQITPGALPNGQVGVPFQTTITGNGGVTPYTWAVTGALPAGLSLNVSSGAIAGTPTQAGTSAFTIVLTDSAGQTAQKLSSITIAAAGPVSGQVVITPSVPPAVNQGATFKFTANVPVTWAMAPGSQG